MLACMNPESVAPLTFIRRGQPVTLRNVPPERTLLELLREDLNLCATKEGCGEGDCGACTVVLAEAHNGQLRYRAVNSCIRLAHSVAGMAVFTAEDLAAPTGELHPAQAALVQCHGSQCGFCTPGFVMSLFGMYQNAAGESISREQAQVDLSGNLCRCTGYRPILDAAQTMQQLPLPPSCAPNEAATLAALQTLAPPNEATDSAYLRPRTLAQLLQHRARYPQAQVVAGCTDVGLWVTKQHRRFDRVLDVTGTQALQHIHTVSDNDSDTDTDTEYLHIGAAVSLTDAFAALVQHWPEIRSFSQRFAGLPVRNAGTLGGNVANGSPIGDSMPLLIALGARVVLMRWQATPEGGETAQRELPLEDLYTGYRTNVMQPDELLCFINVPKPGRPEFMRVYKISKRFDDDISAVCLAIHIRLQNGTVQQVSIGAGGVAATPVRARQTEAALQGQPWNADTVRAAMATLRAEFQPISDMRASASYRRTVLGNLLQRFWLESQGHTAINLDNTQTLEALA
jgi:xanthine dehydrogenase small subunit